MVKNSIIFLGTSASVPQKNRFTQSVAICGSKECIVADAGEGMQIRMNEAGIDHRYIRTIALSHIHGDHVHGILPFIETLKMRLESQRVEEKFVLTIVSPRDFCTYIENSIKFFGTTNGDVLKVSCTDSRNLSHKHEPVATASNEIKLLPIPVEHGALEEAYGFYIEVYVRRKSVGIFYSGDGLCRDECQDRLKRLKPMIVIHETTFLDYPRDSAKAYESGHATVHEASLLATEVNAHVLILTHFSARYHRNDISDFISRARRMFHGVVFLAEDLAKVPLDLLILD